MNKEIIEIALHDEQYSILISIIVVIFAKRVVYLMGYEFSKRIASEKKISIIVTHF